MKNQIAQLGFRNFVMNEGKVVSSNSENCPSAVKLTLEEFLSSKEPGKPTKLVPYSGHQIANGILSRINEIVPDQKRSWGDVFVYRDTMRHPGYVTKLTRETQNSKMLTPETPISDLVFERFIGTVDVIGTDDHSAKLAFKFEPGKFEMAMGLNVKICSNFNIFGGKRITTERGIGYDDLMGNLETWLKNIEKEFGYDIATINQLSEQTINQSQINEMLGEMLQRYHQNKQIIQLTDISALSKNIITKNDVKTLWDFTQAGTEVLRFDDNSGSAILETIESFNEFVMDKQLVLN